MERERLPHELLLLIAESLWRPQYLEVRTCMCWHRCSRVLYALYIEKAPATLRNALNAKLRHADALCQKMPSSSQFRDYMLLQRGVIQMGLRTLVEIELGKMFERFKSYCATTPAKRNYLKEYSLALSGINLDEIEGLCFQGGTNADALRVLSNCAVWVLARYNLRLMICCLSPGNWKMHKSRKKRVLTYRPLKYTLYVNLLRPCEH
jgi:hypothetical protein